MLEREHASPGGAEQVDPLERKLGTNRVHLFAENGDRPLDVPRAIRAAATKLVVDHERAFVGKPLEWAEVVVRRPWAAVESKQRHCIRRQVAGDPIPGAVSEIVEIALRN